jgi:hypothetical protein
VGAGESRMGQEVSEVKLPVSTLADQVTWATDLLRPLWRLAVLQVLSAKVMHLDATDLPVLDREAAGGKRLGAPWGYVADENVAACLMPRRARSGTPSGTAPPRVRPPRRPARPDEASPSARRVKPNQARAGDAVERTGTFTAPPPRKAGVDRGAGAAKGATTRASCEVRGERALRGPGRAAAPPARGRTRSGGGSARRS